MSDNLVWFSTRYWTTKGIEEFGDGKFSGPSDMYIKAGYRFERVGSDAFLTREEAVASCEKKRTNKLASLRRSIKAIEAMDFKTVKENKA